MILTPPPSRPVVAGNCGLNSHLSELISLVLEPITLEADGCEINSTSEMLSRLDNINVKLSENKVSLNSNFEASPNVKVHVDKSQVESKVSAVESTSQSSNISKSKVSKGDIRSFGKLGVKTSYKPKNKEIELRIKSLKQSSNNLLPNLSDRMKAGLLLDVLEDNQPIKVGSGCGRKKLQKQGSKNLCFIGHDVKSLFPSLKSVESARLTRHAILNSKVQVENFDHKMALRYLFIVGGRELITKIGLSRHMPKWLGDREDLVAVGGKKSKSAKSWRDSDRSVWPSEKKMILAAFMEIMVNLVMSTHVYYFAGKFYLQRDSGPIGLRSTACLAALIMKLWDLAWQKLAEREGLQLVDYFRYVDDCRNMLLCLLEGWRWEDGEFKFKSE